MIEQTLIKINSWSLSLNVGILVVLVIFIYFILSHRVSQSISKETNDIIILQAITHTEKIVTLKIKEEVKKLDEAQTPKLNEILAKLN